MTKISNETIYGTEDPISEHDYVIGTDGDSPALKTKSFNFGNIRNFVKQGLEPVTGGTLAINEIPYTGALTTPQDVVNQLVPNKSITAYEVLIVNVNGNKYITKVQNRVVGDTQTPTVASDYISLMPVLPTIADATTTTKGVLQLAGDLAGTAALPTVPGLLLKQNTLVSGTNIKTLNGNSLLGGGDLVIPTATDATTLAKGIVQLAGDLGGTAASPTTPTAIHKSGNESRTGILTISNSAATPSRISLTNVDGNGTYVLSGVNTNGGSLIALQNDGGSGSCAMSVNITSTGDAIVAKGYITSTGFLFTGKNELDVNTFTVNRIGNVTANSFIKSGGTASQYLMANGTVSTSIVNTIVNRGWFSGLDVGGMTIGATLTVSGSITSVTVTDNDGPAGYTVLRCVLTNAMPNVSYKVDFCIESLGTLNGDARLVREVFKIINTTTFDYAVRESSAGSQNLKVHVDAIAL